MIDQLMMLREFHSTFRAHLEDEPTSDLTDDTIALRVSLIQEELDEYRKAAEARDLVGVADALSDLMYVVLGTYVSHGLHLHAEPLFAEVHRSNMSKLDDNGEPIFREDGKVLKSDNFEHPDLESILAMHLLKEHAADRSLEASGHDG
jgi:predicted HAD superfamily Cof-like phosphohydrolase